jgi:TolB-like protein/Tfp pilus assembly protein PilF
VVTGWLLIEVASVLLPTFEAPPWVLKVLSAFILLGFPIALVFAWAYELTSEGLKRESEVDRSESIMPGTGRRLDRIIIGLLAIAVVYFVVERQSDPGGPAPAPAETPQVTEAGSPEAAAARALDKSIAVLPFANLSGNPDTESFVAGLHDDLLTQLSKIHELKVISRTSVLGYAGTTRKIGEIGRELGVSTVLEGGVQRAGERVRINVQLIAVDSDEHLWAETYDRELSVSNIFDIQSEITRQIAGQLRAALTEGESVGLESRPTENLEAYTAYLDANVLYDQAGYGDFALLGDARRAAERAVSLDPGFADAWAMLGWILLNEFWYEGRSPAKAAEAEAAIQRAIGLDPNSAAARRAYGWYLYWVFFNYADAIPQFRQAIALEPSSANAWDGLASVYRRSGRWSEAVTGFEKAVERSPTLPLEGFELIQTLIAIRDFRTAQARQEDATRRFPGNDSIALLGGQLASQRTGDHSEILGVMRRMSDNELAHDSFRLNYVLVEGWFGEVDRALAYLEAWSPELVDVQYGYWPGTLLKGYLEHLAGNRARSEELALASLGPLEQAGLAEPENVEIEKARGIALALLGRTEEAVASARRVRELYPPSHDAFGGLEFMLDSISIASIAGDVETGIEWLGQYAAIGRGPTLTGLRTSRAFRNVVADPRFEAIAGLEGAGTPD